MLLAAALVPDTALLVPGAAGLADPLAAERSAALEAVGSVVAARPARLVVVGVARGSRLRTSGPVRPSLAGAGIADAVLVTPRPGRPEPVDDGATTVDHVGAAVALWLLRAAGWAGGVEVVTFGSTDLDEAFEHGRDLGRDPATSVGLILVGSLSARRGPHAPLPEDERAEAFDDGVLADLVAADPAALERLRAVPVCLATDLAVSARVAWQVLVGATLDHPVTGRLHRVAAPLGATCAVVSWGPR